MKKVSESRGVFLVVAMLLMAGSLCGQRYMETLTRGVVVAKTGSDKAFVSWRLLETDAKDVTFNVYRKTGKTTKVKINSKPIVKATCFEDSNVDFGQDNSWIVMPIADGNELQASKPYVVSANTQARSYFKIPLQTPRVPRQWYRPNDGSVGDLDGDGDYDIVVHMSSRGRDNGHGGMTSPPIFQAYTMEGELLWSINLGENIREGAHYTQFMVYDFNNDGKAEVVMKTADGSIDGKGNVIGDADANHVNEGGHVYKGPEYLTIFDGATGEAISTVKYLPARHPETENPTPQQMKEVWGDDHYNRSERYLACVAYLDGVHPSVVMCRGYYTRTVIAAWDFDGDKLKSRWVFDTSSSKKNRPYAGQGNHSVSVADIDNDGKDEIIYGAMVVDDDGTGKYTTGFGHGDALHVSDLDPQHPGLEIFDIQERFDDAGMHFRDANTGEVLWKVASVKADEEGGDKGEGPGRGVAFDVDPRYSGNECWVFGAEIHGMYSAKGEKISEVTPASCNFGIWWDGDLLREILDDNIISKWNWDNEELEPLMVAYGCSSNNGTKSTPVLSADLFGDWREEVIFRSKDNQSLWVYTTTIPTEHRFVTLMHDPVYRLSVAWQNVGYNQPPHTSYYMGSDKK